MFADIRDSNEHGHSLSILDISPNADFEDFIAVLLLEKAAKWIATTELLWFDEVNNPV